MAKRRGNFEGSVYQQCRKNKDGSHSLRWCAFASVRLDDGRRLRVSGTDPDKETALLKCETAKRNAKERQGKLSRDRQTVAAFLERWLEEQKKGQIEETTFVSYSTIVRKHIVPYIGTMKTANIPSIDLGALYAKQRSNGASTRIAQVTYRIIDMACKHGIKTGQVRSNPCAPLKMPRHISKETIPLTQVQTVRLLEVARQTHLYALIVLAVTTGARQGELFGLQWGDLHEKTLSIRRQVRNISNKHPEIVTRTKNGKGRNVALSELALDALAQHRENMISDGLDVADGSLIFADRDGRPMRRENYVRRHFRPLLIRAKLPRIRFHDLRHTCATILLEENQHPKTVQALLGHHSAAFTLDRYSAWIPQMGERAASAMDAIFRTKD